MDATATFRRVPEGFEILSRTAFERNGLQVEELICKWDEYRHRVIWCLSPFELMTVGDKLNPLCHSDISGGLNDPTSPEYAVWLEQCRRKVADYWDDFQSKLQHTLADEHGTTVCTTCRMSGKLLFGVLTCPGQIDTTLPVTRPVIDREPIAPKDQHDQITDGGVGGYSDRRTYGLYHVQHGQDRPTGQNG